MCIVYNTYPIWQYIYFENNNIQYVTYTHLKRYEKFLKQNTYIIAIVRIQIKIKILRHCQNKIINYCHHKSISFLKDCILHQ